MKESKRNKRVTVGFIALGCPKNVVDSERMLAQIVQAGFLINARPEEADVVVINTCAFIKPAIEEAITAIKQAVEWKRRGRVRKVVVAGCLPQRFQEELFNQTDGIDTIVGLADRDKIAKIIKETLTAQQKTAYLEPLAQTVADDRCRLLITHSHSAYLRISEGCDHKCSFCTIPEIRGRFRSKSEETILTEAEELIWSGVVELNIIAQDTTYYGRDLKIKDGLVGLLEKLEKIEGLKWIRLMYLNPSRIDERLIDTIAGSEKIVHYLDVPIQHINEQILEKMRRVDSKKSIYSLVEKLRSRIVDCVLRTTLIVGFPGETDEQFAELLEFVEWAKFDALGCFEYYPEQGTAAAEMPNQVSDGIKQQRFEELMLTQQKIVFGKNESRVGTELVCLIESVDEQRKASGRFYGQAPDIDSVCIVQDCSAKPGDFINTEVVGAKEYDLLVDPVGDQMTDDR